MKWIGNVEVHCVIIDRPTEVQTWLGFERFIALDPKQPLVVSFRVASLTIRGRAHDSIAHDQFCPRMEFVVAHVKPDHQPWSVQLLRKGSDWIWPTESLPPLTQVNVQWRENRVSRLNARRFTICDRNKSNLATSVKGPPSIFAGVGVEEASGNKDRDQNQGKVEAAHTGALHVGLLRVHSLSGNQIVEEWSDAMPLRHGPGDHGEGTRASSKLQTRQSGIGSPPPKAHLIPQARRVVHKPAQGNALGGSPPRNQP
jgi:hypothetical protein